MEGINNEDCCSVFISIVSGNCSPEKVYYFGTVVCIWQVTMNLCEYRLVRNVHTSSFPGAAELSYNWCLVSASRTTHSTAHESCRIV